MAMTTSSSIRVKARFKSTAQGREHPHLPKRLYEGFICTELTPIKNVFRPLWRSSYSATVGRFKNAVPVYCRNRKNCAELVKKRTCGFA